MSDQEKCPMCGSIDIFYYEEDKIVCSECSYNGYKKEEKDLSEK